MENMIRHDEMNPEFYLTKAKEAMMDGREEDCVKWYFEGMKKAFSESEILAFQKMIAALL